MSSSIKEQSVAATNQDLVRVNLEHAPLTETSVGFYFHGIPNWNVFLQGILWERFHGQYPVLETLPTILQQQTVAAQFQLNLNSPVLRSGFSNADKTQLVQIQDGMLLHNWRKTADSPRYGRYEKLKGLFRSDWEIFLAFLKEKSLPAPAIVRCEMSYFNNLVRGEDWNDFADLTKIVAPWRDLLASTSHGTIQTAAVALTYKLSEGSVNASAQAGIRVNDGKEVLQLTLTSSVQPKSSDQSELFRCLDVCHENAHRAFYDFTTDEAREKWR